MKKGRKKEFPGGRPPINKWEKLQMQFVQDIRQQKKLYLQQIGRGKRG